MTKRVFLIVLDSFGIGHAADASSFHDEGSNTLETIQISSFFSSKTMDKLGLHNIENVQPVSLNTPIGAYARLEEQSKGKDTTSGHWEIAGRIIDTSFPTYPNGFPDEIIDSFTKKIGKGILCNKPFSGTEVIQVYGDEHRKTGKPIVYTSADSVFQIAAHTDIIPESTLYEYCEIARKILSGKHAVGRVIARPFTGESGCYTRTSGRHDYSLLPPVPTMLNLLQNNKFDVLSVGKIRDIFAGQGISEYKLSSSNTEGMQITKDIQKKSFNGLCFVNLVDFDMKYGHRNDIDGYAKAIAEFDSWLTSFINDMQEDDVLFITADHGCDPGFPGTDHTRENVPLLVYGQSILPIDLGTRHTYADIAKTILDIFEISCDQIDGISFLKEVKKT